jgi:hypothetical protein
MPFVNSYKGKGVLNPEHGQAGSLSRCVGTPFLQVAGSAP